jgi:hypothetical protein
MPMEENLTMGIRPSCGLYITDILAVTQYNNLFTVYADQHYKFLFYCFLIQQTVKNKLNTRSLAMVISWPSPLNNKLDLTRLNQREFVQSTHTFAFHMEV